MYKIVPIILFMLGLPSAALAQGTPVTFFNKPTGWAVASNTVFGSNGLPVAYNAAYDSATSSAANYVLSEYGGSGMFGSLYHTTQGSTQTWSETAAPGGWLNTNVSFSSGTYSMSVTENSVGLPCTRNNVAAEYDVFMGPNTYDMGTNVVSGIGTAYKVHPEDAPYLSQMAALTVSGQAVIGSVSQSVTPASCSVNHGDVIYGFTIVNRTANQQISYALTLGHLCLPGPDYQSCTYEATKTLPVWYKAGALPAITDNPTSFSSGITFIPYGGVATNLPLDGPGTATLTSVNFLPRLEAVIQNNPYGLDTNISHWQMGAPLYGTNIWGDSAITTTWYGLNPAASCIRPNCS